MPIVFSKQLLRLGVSLRRNLKKKKESIFAISFLFLTFQFFVPHLPILFNINAFMRMFYGRKGKALFFKS